MAYSKYMALAICALALFAQVFPADARVALAEQPLSTATGSGDGDVASKIESAANGRNLLFFGGRGYGGGYGGGGYGGGFGRGYGGGGYGGGFGRGYGGGGYGGFGRSGYGGGGYGGGRGYFGGYPGSGFYGGYRG